MPRHVPSILDSTKKHTSCPWDLEMLEGGVLNQDDSGLGTLGQDWTLFLYLGSSHLGEGTKIVVRSSSQYPKLKIFQVMPFRLESYVTTILVRVYTAMWPLLQRARQGLPRQ